MKRTKVKSCCGSCSYVFELDKPIVRANLTAFIDAGYATSENYTKIGIFFVKKGGLTASGPFNTMKLKVTCSGSANCNQLLDNLENTVISL